MSLLGKLLEMCFYDIANADDVTITTSSDGSAQNTTDITLVSGTYDPKTETIHGKDTEGRNIHLPVKYIIDIK